MSLHGGLVVIYDALRRPQSLDIYTHRENMAQSPGLSQVLRSI